MKGISSYFKGRWFYPIMALLIIGIICLSIWYWYLPKTDEKLNAIISGLITGCVALTLQVWFSWVELKKLEQFDALKIINILATRDDPEYYRPLISNSKREIKILGVTCQRFLEDFANHERNAPIKKQVLLKGLDGGKLKVKILVADLSVLDEENKNKSIRALPRLKQLAEKYPNQFFYAVYVHQPTHSVMVIDDESIVGPIFPGISSQFSPAIHLKIESKFVEHYRDYFDNEWEECYISKKD